VAAVRLRAPAVPRLTAGPVPAAPSRHVLSRLRYLDSRQPAALHPLRRDAPELPARPSDEPPDDELTTLRRATGNRLVIERRLGAGGMAGVFLARHAVLDTPLAVKVLHPHLAREPEMRIRFRREAEAAARLRHPHVCPILDYGWGPGVEYLVMPYLGGGSLADAMAGRRTLAAERAAAVTAQAAQGLDYAHRRAWCTAT
jgi:serine/threonine-protein kinase